MTRIRAWLVRVAGLFRRARWERELADELDAHLQMHVDDNLRAGMTAEEARRQARVRFGGVEAVKEQCRDRRGISTLESLIQDVRLGVRVLRKRPGFTLIGALTLALGIGANTAMFSVVHAVLLRPLPYADPDRLVRIWEVTPRGIDDNVVSSGNYLDWRERASSFEEIGAQSGSFGIGLTGTGEPARVEVTRLSPSALRVLGVSPVTGRGFTEEDVEQGSGAVTLLSYAFWQQRFGGSRDVVGRTIYLDDAPYVIAGVMPPGFDFPTPRTQLWLPVVFDADDRNERQSHQWRVVARLKPGVSVQTAEAEMNALASSIARLHPEEMTGWSVNVVSLRADLVDDVKPLLWVLAGFVLVVLVIASANLAHLLLARAKTREMEFAVRTALGAGRARLARQLVTEVLLLGLVGGALGVGLVGATLRVLLDAAPGDIPLLDDVRIDWVVLTFAVVATVGTSLLAGAIPALRAGRVDLRPRLQGAAPAGADPHGTRLRGVLLVSQFALSILLLTAATLLVESFRRLTAVEHGFDPRGVLAVWLDLPRSRYPNQPAQERFYDELLDRVSAVPGVVSVGATTEPPIAGYQNTFSFAIERRPAPNPTGRADPMSLRNVSPGYFETMRIPLLAGRVFQSSDRQGSLAVVVINRALADRFWPNTDPMGQRISFAGPEGPWHEIIGIVGDTRHDGLDRPAAPAMYMPFAQRRANWGWMSWQILMVRADTGLDPVVLAPAVREVVWSLDPALPLQSVDTVDGWYAESTSRRRFAMQLASGFALLALALAAIGMYGVVACSVADRRREIGVRLALGARPASVVTMVVRQGAVMVAAGIALGAVLAFWAVTWLQALLFDVPARDPTAFLAAALLLLAVAGAASWLPARRAARLDPATVLRGE